LSCLDKGFGKKSGMNQGNRLTSAVCRPSMGLKKQMQQ
jgi:hypothetical protein